jgi:D-sedoheptulose 7-phosphate isomerase
MNASPPSDPFTVFAGYKARLAAALHDLDMTQVEILARELEDCWETGRQVFFIGNGGSAGNATHLVNDLIYPISRRAGSGIRAHSLSANPSVLTCLANDEGYESIFAMQLAVMARPGDVLVALSASGNSGNILQALHKAREIGMRSFAILGATGGEALDLADVPIHVPVRDVQVAEDVQMAIGHMVMQWLHSRRDSVRPAS